eukprot:358964-Chlamydomonas_euryale.AAC.3
MKPSRPRRQHASIMFCCDPRLGRMARPQRCSPSTVARAGQAVGTIFQDEHSHNENMRAVRT